MTAEDGGPAPADATAVREAAVATVGGRDPSRKTGARGDGMSGFAVASLVFGLLGGALGAVFGVTALVRIKQTGQRGRSLAIAGLALAGVWGLAIALLVSFAPYRTAGATALPNLRTGDCFSREESGSGTGFAPAAVADAVPCRKLHDAEVTGFAPLAAARGGRAEYPGHAALTQLADSGCRTVTRDYVLDPLSLPGGTHVRWYIPRAPQWASGSRRIICFLASDEPRWRSLRQDAATVTPEQLRFLLAVRDFDELVDRIRILRPVATWTDLRAAVAEVADANGRLGLRLKAGPWPDAVQPAMDRLVAALDAVAPLWQGAATATSEAELLDLVTRAEAQSAHDAGLEVRRALGLSTPQVEPPR